MNAELFGALPQISLIKTEDVVADQNIGVPGAHGRRPAENHFGLGLKGGHLGTLYRITGTEDEDMLRKGRHAALENDTDLDDWITGKRDRLLESFQHVVDLLRLLFSCWAGQTLSAL